MAFHRKAQAVPVYVILETRADIAEEGDLGNSPLSFDICHPRRIHSIHLFKPNT